MIARVRRTENTIKCNLAIHVGIKKNVGNKIVKEKTDIFH